MSFSRSADLQMQNSLLLWFWLLIPKAITNVSTRLLSVVNSCPFLENTCVCHTCEVVSCQTRSPPSRPDFPSKVSKAVRLLLILRRSLKRKAWTLYFFSSVVALCFQLHFRNLTCCICYLTIWLDLQQFSTTFELFAHFIMQTFL